MKLTPRGQRQMKQMMYLIVWQAIQLKDCEWSKLYEHLVPLKCSFNERTQRYTGRGKVMGRIAGQIISLIFTLLKKDQETLLRLAPGMTPPDPILYDPKLHQQHRAGQYHPSTQEKPRQLIQFPPH